MEILIERKEIAQALNFGKYPVLTFDMDSRKGSKAVVIKQSARYGAMRYKCTLYKDRFTMDDGIFYLMTHATMLSAHIGVDDYLKDAEYANAPIIDADTEVAILVHSKKLNACHVVIVKSGKVDASYSTATVFE